ncbi:Wadjet anti-phage system protein JetA family protein [Sphingomonas sp. 3-13AW]|uniref:Wadjet anti-phage system protein JetA family protein n=1 Tax=Sphingomonas sp. 3-13AW TaxID=3050450 RepID=UPI003BB6BE1B
MAVYRHFFVDEVEAERGREDVVGFISDVMRNEDVDGAVMSAVTGDRTEITQNPQLAYRRLVEAGWLVEHRRGYNVLVDVEPGVALLLDALDGIETGEAQHYGGTISAIDAVVTHVGDEPRERAAALADTAGRARRFRQHLGSVLSGLRAIERRILASPDPDAILSGFFDEFVAGSLIADYRALKTRNNPFRHRDRVISATSAYLSDQALLAQVAAGYVEQGLAPDADAGLQRAAQHLALIGSVFVQSGDRLDEIDEFRMRLEKRIVRTLSYMVQVDEALGPKTARLASYVGSAMQDPVAAPSDLSPDLRLLSAASLRRPRVRRDPPPPTAVSVGEPNVYLIELGRALRAHALAMTPRDNDVVQFAEIALGARRSVSSTEITVTDPVHVIMLQRLRTLSINGSRRLRDLYDVSVDRSTYHDNGWTVSHPFMLSRRSEAC